MRRVIAGNLSGRTRGIVLCGLNLAHRLQVCPEFLVSPAC